jgi:protein-disulfide isomerase
MNGLLYENQQAWSSNSNAVAIFQNYAKQLQLNVDQFKKDFSSRAVNDAINADIAAFDKTKQEKSTPTFFLDGKKIKASSVDEFSKLIDDAIAAKSKQQ